jgi:hypothetical protein
MSIELGDAVGATWMKWRVFVLWLFLGGAENLAAAGLIETNVLVNLANCFEQSRDA